MRVYNRTLFNKKKKALNPVIGNVERPPRCYAKQKKLETEMQTLSNFPSSKKMNLTVVENGIMAITVYEESGRQGRI